jgi:hypothetical protein
MTTARRVGWVLLAIGAALLALAAYAYYAIAVRPLSWGMAEARVASSRVVNPKRREYLAEIVLDVYDGASPRRVKTVTKWGGPRWMMQRYVDGYPAGAGVAVAVNPKDRDDVRFELGPTPPNLIAPVAFALIGVVFVLLGWRRRVAARTPGPY